MKDFAAFILGIIGSPYALFQYFKDPEKRWSPVFPTEEDRVPDKPGSFWHYSKNFISESFRRNPQFWSRLTLTLLILATIF